MIASCSWRPCPHSKGHGIKSITTFLVLLQLKVICSQEPVLTYERYEQFDGNLIVMGCVEASDDLLREEPVFYRNNEVFYRFGRSVENDPNRVVETITTFNNEKQITFIINRAAEGHYQCAFASWRPRSFPISIISKSIYQLTLTVHTHSCHHPPFPSFSHKVPVYHCNPLLAINKIIKSLVTFSP